MEEVWFSSQDIYSLNLAADAIVGLKMMHDAGIPVNGIHMPYSDNGPYGFIVDCALRILPGAQIENISGDEDFTFTIKGSKLRGRPFRDSESFQYIRDAVAGETEVDTPWGGTSRVRLIPGRLWVRFEDIYWGGAGIIEPAVSILLDLHRALMERPIEGGGNTGDDRLPWPRRYAANRDRRFHATPRRRKGRGGRANLQHPA